VQPSTAPITISIEAQNNLTVFTVKDVVDSEQLLAQVVSFLAESPTPLALWDLKPGSLASMASKELQSIVDRGKQFAESRRGGRTAIVCATDLDYGLCRMFETYAEISDLPFAINVFRNHREAREWLSGNTKGYSRATE
jgi:hypothetical protein